MAAKLDIKKEDLERLSKSKTRMEIAEMYGVSSNTIRTYLDKWGLECMIYCHGCRENRPQSEFSSTSARTCIRSHGRIYYNRSCKLGGLSQDVYEDEARVHIEFHNSHTNKMPATEGNLRYYWHEETHSEAS